MQKRGSPPPPPSPGPPSCANGSPQLSPQPPAHARAHAGHTHPTPVRGSAWKTPGPRRLRTQQHANHIEGHVRQPRLVEHGHRLDGVTTWCEWREEQTAAVQIPNSQSPALGMAAAPSDCEPLRLTGAGTWAVWVGPPCHRGQSCPGLFPSRSRYWASGRRSVASGACSLSAGPSRPIALRCPVPSPTGRASSKDEDWRNTAPPAPGAPQPASARSRRLQRAGTKPRPAQTANQRHRPRPADLRSPPRIWKLVNGAGPIAGIGSPLFSPFSPLVLGDASFKGEPDPGTPFHSSCCPPSFSSHGLSLQTV